MKRQFYVRLTGHVAGKAWGGYKANLPVDVQINHEQRFERQIERLIRSHGDFEWCALDRDSVIEVVCARSEGARFYEYTRIFHAWEFPSIARWVR